MTGRWTLTIVTVALAACTVDPQPEWEEVQQVVAERTSQAVVWEQTQEDAAVIDSAVRGLLAGGLGRGESAQLAVLNNRRLQGTFEEVGVAKARIVQATLLSNPNLFYEAEFPVSSGRTGLEGMLMFFLSDAWIIPIRREFAQATAAATLLRVEAEIIDTAADAVLAYNDVLFRQELLRIEAERLDIFQDAAGREKVRYDSGLADDHQVYDAEARAIEAQIQLARAERDLLQARAALAEVLNLAPEQADVRLTDELKLADDELRTWDYQETVAYAFENRLDLAAARFNVERADRAVDLEQARIFDFVQVGVSHEGEVNGPQFVGPAVRLELPIFDQNQGEIARMEYRRRQFKKDLQALEAHVRRQLRHLLAEIAFRRHHVRLYESQLYRLRELAVEYTKKYAAIFRLPWPRVVRAREERLQTRLEYVHSLWHLVSSEVLLERALLGGGGLGRGHRRVHADIQADRAVDFDLLQRQLDVQLDPTLPRMERRD
ncbi:MAG: TolC family protein [Planctomycetes bacterium]|nr:TolC family protein [Planctomycetota bacterium]